MKTLAALAGIFLLAVGSQQAAAASKAEKCAHYKEQLARIAEAEKRGGSKERLHKLEARRHKILAAQAKLGC